MTDDREQPPQLSDDSNPEPSPTDSSDTCSNSVYASLVRQNKLVDEDSLRESMDVAKAEGRGVLEVLVERGQISTRMGQAIRLMAEDMEATASSGDDVSTSGCAHLANPARWQ